MKAINLSSNFIKKIREYNPNGKDTEEGGIVFATVYSDYIILEDITTPSKFDKKGKFLFYRKKKVHQKIIKERWGISNGLLHYIGEWHTHPESRPHPSWIDKQEMKKSYKKNKFMTSFLLQIIVGYKYLWVGYVSNNTDLKGLMYIEYNCVPYKILPLK